MSEQEKKSGGTAPGLSPVVMVESTASRHKSAPYRPTDLQDEATPELHHKRSRAPAVPSVAEELKDASENTLKERKECDKAMSSEKHKHVVVKKLSSTTKKRGSSPETIPMAAIEAETKRAGMITPPSQPIPTKVAPVASIVSDITEKTDEKKGDEDSITEEIGELRTPDPTHKSSEWDIEKLSPKYLPNKQEAEESIPLQRKLASEVIDNKTENIKDAPRAEIEDAVPLNRKLGSEVVNESITSTQNLKKKEISWCDATYLDRVQLQNLNTQSAARMLERKASVGPCYRNTMPFGEPSGITICVPKKSLNISNDVINLSKSGISLTVSKRSINNNLRRPLDFELKVISDQLDLPKREIEIEIKTDEDNCAHFFGNLKGKLEHVRGKIKHVLHI